MTIPDSGTTLWSQELCFVFAYNDFAKSLAWVGPFFFFMSLLMCFSVRCPYIRDEDLNNSPENSQNLDKPLSVQVELQTSPNNNQLDETQNRSNNSDQGTIDGN